jgi:hypothetical protein
MKKIYAEWFVSKLANTRNPGVDRIGRKHRRRKSAKPSATGNGSSKFSRRSAGHWRQQNRVLDPQQLGKPRRRKHKYPILIRLLL